MIDCITVDRTTLYTNLPTRVRRPLKVISTLETPQFTQWPISLLSTYLIFCPLASDPCMSRGQRRERERVQDSEKNYEYYREKENLEKDK